MVDLSKEGPRGVSRIIRGTSWASLTAAAVLLAACSGGSANGRPPATASAPATARPSPSASFEAGPVWVLTPVGLNMRASPDTSAQRLATLQQGVWAVGRRVWLLGALFLIVGLGISILTTPKGVLSGVQARKLGVGGEVLCNVW